jgi:hydroxypyruvate reductase
MTNLASAPGSDRDLLEHLYRVAVAAVDPGPAVAQALADDDAARAARGGALWILSLGKAAVPMARGAAQVARSAGLAIAGGLVVGSVPEPSPDASLPVVAGDHPEPGAASLAAATLLGQVVDRIRPGDHVWILLSGGATSLIGAPLPGLGQADLRALYALLLGSGLDITAMNRIRKRFTRWGGGKLARALAGAHIRQYVVSDVIGDDLPSIGSGPCIGDPTTATDVRRSLEQGGLWERIPAPLQAFINDAIAGRAQETPKPGDAAIESVKTRVVSSNRLALKAAAAEAARLGLVPEVMPAALAGEASVVGTSVAATLRNYSQSRPTQGAARRCVIWGGETTVTLGGSTGSGGRSQELALAAAAVLAGTEGISLLAAGTDGRDGPTDAAGAFVNGSTWARIAAAGHDPAAALHRHDAYPALAAAGALFKPGVTGTNVMDVVAALT